MAVIAADHLWIDGQDFAWHHITNVALIRMKGGTLISVESPERNAVIPLYPLANAPETLNAAIAERLENAREAG